MGRLIADTAFSQKPADKESLLAIKVGDLSINDRIVELVGKIGEKIEVSEYVHMKGEAVVSYIHAGSKLGVLVSLKGVNGKDVTDAGKDVGMQIAAMNPLAVDAASIPASTIERERNIVIETMKADPKMAGKTDEMLGKIAEGKLNAFFKEQTLLAQPFVKDAGVSVEAYLKSVDPSLKVTEFKRVALG